MDLPWGDERTIQFVTNVGLITSDGPHGPNIMAAEWTHQVSYSPGLIAVCIGQGKATAENITKTKVFGVSIAADDQNVVASVAGGSSGKNIDKIGALQEMNVSFRKGDKLPVLLVEGAVLQAECKLVQTILLGDHTMFVGEIVATHLDTKKNPLAYHKGKYWKLETTISKPSESEREKMKNSVGKFSKKA